jgi:copper chaperone
MALKLKVPNMACADCGESITEAIHTMEPDAKVDIDVQGKTVSVVSQASEETIKQAIVAAGYQVEGY